LLVILLGFLFMANRSLRLAVHELRGVFAARERWISGWEHISALAVNPADDLPSETA
jgi:hypothetical protein